MHELLGTVLGVAIGSGLSTIRPQRLQAAALLPALFAVGVLSVSATGTRARSSPHRTTSAPRRKRSSPPTAARPGAGRACRSRARTRSTAILPSTGHPMARRGRSL